jgi:single-stranded-DNA-specific exonuclease
MYFLDQEKPVIAISRVENVARMSTRGSQYLISKGLDLASACRVAAESVGGNGGGHDIAAGATVPADREGDFLDALDRIIGEQFKAAGDEEL